MTLEVQFALIVLLAFVAGFAIAWILMRFRVSAALEAGKAATAPELMRLSTTIAAHEEKAEALSLQVAAFTESLGQFEAENRDLEKRLALAEQTCQTIPALKADIAQRETGLETIQTELRQTATALAREAERSARLKTAEEKLEDGARAADALKAMVAEKNTEISELRTRLNEERKQATEKLALLNEARTDLTNQFRVLAQEILDEKGKTFGEQSRTGLKTLLDPFRDQLAEFRQKVDSVYVHEAQERASLKKEIESLRDLNQKINQEALNLTRALKGDKKAQGTWGELILERVLEQSGLRKGEEYEAQGGFRDADGKLLKPDVIVHLPEEKDVVVDSKVSLLAYERFATSEDETERAGALSEHLRAVRAHIEALSGKDYSALKGIRSLDFVLMFMPIEAAFVAAFREDDTLYTYAFEKRIVVVTPSTLLATLKTIENIWRYERQNRSAQEIVARAGAIYEKLRLFVESMEKLGKQLDTAQGTFDEAMGRLVRGRGNVISQAARFIDLGVAVKKPLPRTITEMAEIEGGHERAQDDTADEESQNPLFNE
ncbi:MAG: DNA recombination protein RmuC [Desulfobacterales bacterium]|nr:DNA recombination protein RmuC [Desulfobacterales bacterium]